MTFQANTADAEVEDLDNSVELVSEDAEVFANRIAPLHRRFGLRILGGCCGSTPAHIAAIAQAVKPFPPHQVGAAHLGQRLSGLEPLTIR